MSGTIPTFRVQPTPILWERMLTLAQRLGLPERDILMHALAVGLVTLADWTKDGGKSAGQEAR